MYNRLQVIGNMVLFGTIPLVVVGLNLSSPAIIQWRTLIGSIFLFLLATITKKPVGWDGIRKTWLPLTCSGICLGLNWITIFESYQTISVGITIVICYSAPILVFLLSPLLFRTHTTRAEVIGIIATVLGMVLMNLTSQVDGMTGGSLLFPCLAALCYAGVLISGRYITGVSGRDSTLVQMVISFLIATLYSVLRMGELTQIPTSMGWVILVVLGILHTGLGYTLFFHLISKVPAQEFALLSYVEPASALLLAGIVLKEQMTPAQLLGAALIFGGVIYAQIRSQPNQDNRSV